MKRFNATICIVDTNLITSALLLKTFPLSHLKVVFSCLFGIALSETSLLFSLATANTRTSFNIFSIMQEKHNAIKLLVQSMLDSNVDIVSQEMRDRDNSSMEFHKVLKEVKKYRRLKAGIRNQTKTKIRQGSFSNKFINTFYEPTFTDKSVSK